MRVLTEWRIALEFNYHAIAIVLQRNVLDKQRNADIGELFLRWSSTIINATK
jgi:hypothetical protein